jgi:diaminohydroxyphosphoribosylaminopyrimidine deaminase/5-amino-6-(5-phosphoribosylamino)uracil reductase
MTIEEKFMKECITLAAKGKGKVAPNPLVGCVIVMDKKIIGKGYHKEFGKNHAEINAIKEALKSGYNFKNASLYVNLEPCTHYGKTPPCTDEIIKYNFKNVFIGMRDPNKFVNGKGIKKLKSAGINVLSDVLKNECEDLNKVFIKNIACELPYVTLKIGQSIDGKIALKNFVSKYITGKESRKFVYNLRGKYDAILIGTKTAYYDNPDLTTHSKRGKNPARIVIDRDYKLSSTLKIFSDKHSLKTYRIVSDNFKDALSDNIIRVRSAKNGNFQMIEILKELYKKGITSLLVEGGANVFSQFIKDYLYDDIYFIVVPKILGEGISSFDNFAINKLSDAVNLKLISLIQSKQDLIIYYKK